MSQYDACYYYQDLYKLNYFQVAIIAAYVKMVQLAVTVKVRVHPTIKGYLTQPEVARSRTRGLHHCHTLLYIHTTLPVYSLLLLMHKFNQIFTHSQKNHSFKTFGDSITVDNYQL